MKYFTHLTGDEAFTFVLHIWKSVTDPVFISYNFHSLLSADDTQGMMILRFALIFF